MNSIKKLMPFSGWVLSLVCLILVQAFPSYSNEIQEITSAITATGGQWTAKQNRISILPGDERAKRLGALEEPDTGEIAEQFVFLPMAVPSQYDWRNVSGQSYVTPVRDQGSCGSCWAFATTAALESQVLLTFDESATDLNLSEQIVLSCSGAGNCSAGGYASTASNFLRDTGTGFEICSPYTATDGNCSSACVNWQDSAYRLSSWSYVVSGGTANVEAVKNAIYTKGPVGAWYKVYEDHLYYDSGVYSYTWGPYLGNHFVLVVGWDDASNAFIVKNSWGADWGESGYFRIAYSELSGTTEFGRWTYVYGSAVGSSPDLVVTNVSGPSGGIAGSDIDVSADLENQGSTTTGGFRLGFYFSPDSTITKGDTFSGYYCYFPSGAPAGYASTCRGPLTVPLTLTPGTYYLGAIIDDLENVTEDNEDNNVRLADTGPIVISPRGPDLTGRWISLYETCKNTRKGPKCKISGTLEIQNAGNQDALSTSVGFYLSENGSYDPGDTWLKAVSTGKIKAGSTKLKKMSYNLPVGQTAAGKHVIPLIDEPGLVAEINETNNIVLDDLIP